MLRLLVVVVVATVGMASAAAAPIAVGRGTRLVGTLTNAAGETSSLSLRFVVCGVTRRGRTFCRGRFRGCGGPGCVGRAGGITYRPSWRHGPLLSLYRGGKQCHLHLAPAQDTDVLTGTYRCITVDSGEVDVPRASPFDRGTFVLSADAS